MLDLVAVESMYITRLSVDTYLFAKNIAVTSSIVSAGNVFDL